VTFFKLNQQLRIPDFRLCRKIIRFYVQNLEFQVSDFAGEESAYLLLSILSIIIDSTKIKILQKMSQKELSLEEIV